MADNIYIADVYNTMVLLFESNNEAVYARIHKSLLGTLKFNLHSLL